jgi:thioredoxin-related protein
MKKKILIALMLLFSGVLFSQDLSKFRLYSPTENASKAIAESVKQAKSAKKHVFIQIGGNWCIWCARFNDMVTTDGSIDSLIKANFVVYHLNYSPENKNEAILTKYGFPQRFGFPVFLVLDGNGKLLHTQNSAYLEQDKSYNREKVMDFFSNWSPLALDPKQYKE